MQRPQEKNQIKWVILYEATAQLLSSVNLLVVQFHDEVAKLSAFNMASGSSDASLHPFQHSVKRIRVVYVLARAFAVGHLDLKR